MPTTSVCTSAFVLGVLAAALSARGPMHSPVLVRDAEVRVERALAGERHWDDGRPCHPPAAQLAVHAELHRASDAVAGSNEVLVDGGAYADNIVADLAVAKHFLQSMRD